MEPKIPLKVELVRDTPLYLSCCVKGDAMPAEFTFKYHDKGPVRIWVSTEKEKPGPGSCCIYKYGKPAKLSIMEPDTKRQKFRENDIFPENTIYLTLSSDTYMKLQVTYEPQHSKAPCKHLHLKKFDHKSIGNIIFSSSQMLEE